MKKILAVIALGSILSACGGGGSTGSYSPPISVSQNNNIASPYEYANWNSDDFDKVPRGTWDRNQRKYTYHSNSVSAKDIKNKSYSGTYTAFHKRDNLPTNGKVYIVVDSNAWHADFTFTQGEIRGDYRVMINDRGPASSANHTAWFSKPYPQTGANRDSYGLKGQFSKQGVEGTIETYNHRGWLNAD